MKSKCLKNIGLFILSFLFFFFSQLTIQPANAQAPIGKITGQAIAVNDGEQFIDALYNPEVEVIELNSHITIQSSGAHHVRSNTKQKVIEGNGYTLIANNNSHIYNDTSNINQLFIRNISNMYSHNSNSTQGFIRFYNDPAELHLENVHFNVDSNPSAGILGASYESTVHFYGNNTFNFLKGETGFRYRKLHIHEKANVIISAVGMSAIQNYHTSLPSGLETGLQIDDSATLSIQASEQAIEHTFIDTPFQFTVGKNAKVQIESTANDAIEVTRAGTQLDIGQGSKIQINGANTALNLSTSRYDPVLFNINGQLVLSGEKGITFGNSKGNFTVHPNGEWIIQSINSAVTTTGLIHSDQIFQVNEGGRFILLRNGRTNEPLLDLSIPAQFNFNKPTEVDLNNSNGLLFSNGSTHHFSISNTYLASWHQANTSNTPTTKTSLLQNGQFILSSNRTRAVNFVPEQPNFEEEFPPSMRRLKLKYIVDPPSIVAPIYDTDWQIRGAAEPGTQVDLLDSNKNLLQTTQTDNNGNFSFELSKPFEVGTTLYFQSKTTYFDSETVEEKVKGNRLEFLAAPKDMNFETTKIENNPELIIHRESNEYKIDILDTRENGNWKLTVQATTPLKTSEGDELNHALFYRSPTVGSFLSIETESQVVGTNQTSQHNNYIDSIIWRKDEGILIKTNPIIAKNKLYQTNLQWTLIDAP